MIVLDLKIYKICTWYQLEINDITLDFNVKVMPLGVIPSDLKNSY